ncbi:MAG: ferritin-like domain-containing protein [Actinomycetota bacterium]|nr:ferritin-like domain-containing protein [Actinomycetota bacterium]
MAERDLVLTWLRNAHAMEKALGEALRRHVRAADGHPDVQSKLRLHLEETRRHAEQMAECIEALGGEVSEAKDVFGQMFGAIENMLTKRYEDVRVKDSIADFAAEQFEIASYRALSEAARQIGEEKVAQVCDEICAQEEEMARWLEQQLPEAVRNALDEAKDG